jgi:predicted molibdopterin-dependent oxidoreductase YjgC
MKIKQHPVLNFKEGRQVSFIFEGKKLTGTEGQPIICALADNNISVIGYSHGRPRGLYCAIGNCGSCVATVNGKANVRTCITPLEEGMVIEMQHKGEKK